MNRKPEPILFLSDARGVYIPRDFANEIRRDCLSGVDDAALDILRTGPDHPLYWDVWADVESSAVVTDPESGVAYYVYQDGDCWLLPEGMIVDDNGDFSWGEES